MSDPYTVDLMSDGFYTFSPSRYPYTYCADYLRGLIETSTSRADMATIKQHIAAIIAMDEYTLACLIADKYLEKNYITKPENVSLT